MLTLKNLTYSHQNKLILKDLSFTFNDREIIGITGAAGAGKSTLINLIKNNKINYEGNILFDKNELNSFTKKEFKKIISHYSSAQNIINPEAIVREWILGGRINHKKRLGSYSKTDREIADSKMSMFGLDQFAETRLKLISETSAKMASLARVFAAQSKILLLEKPEAGLNINQRVLLTKCIKKRTISENSLVILTSSDLNFISATCDRIIVLADNVIAESGTHKIISAEFIKKYYNVEAIVTKNIFSGLPEIQVIEEN